MSKNNTKKTSSSPLKDRFKEYCTQTKFNSETYNNSIIILDTNVLLNMYRISSESREEYFRLLTLNKDRIWITFHTGIEFHNNRNGVIKKHSNDLKKIFNQLNINTDCPILKDSSHKELKDDLIQKVSSLKSDLKKIINEKLGLKISCLEDDYIFDSISNIIEEKITPELSPEEINTLYSEGESRYKNNIPPGYKDRDKEGNKYGDFIIWKEIITLSKEKQKDILFVSNDQKEDWIKDGSVRPELVKEFNQQTNHLFTSISMKEFINEHKNTTNPEKTITLLEEVDFIENQIEIEKYVEYLRKLNISPIQHASPFSELFNSSSDITKLIKNSHLINSFNCLKNFPFSSITPNLDIETTNSADDED